LPFFKINPAGTYLAVSGNDINAVGATRVSLSAFGARPGDAIALSYSGDFKWALQNAGDEASGMIAVFVDDAGRRIASDGPGIVSSPQNEGGGATDIPQDFGLLTTPTVVTIPAGATGILFSSNDSYFGDNSDPDNDYGVTLARFGPDTGLLKFDIPVKSWIAEASGDYRYSGGYTVNGLKVNGSARVAADGNVTLIGEAASPVGDMPLFNAVLRLKAGSGKGAVETVAANYLYFGGLQYQPAAIDLSVGELRLSGGSMALPSGTFGNNALLNWASDGMALRLAPATDAKDGHRYTDVSFAAPAIAGDQHLYFPLGLTVGIQSLGLGYDEASKALTLWGDFSANTLLKGAFAEITLKVDEDKPMKISGGQLSAGTVVFGVDDFEAGGFSFKDAKLTGSLFENSSTVALGIAADVGFPSNSLFQVGKYLIEGVSAEIGITLSPFTLNTFKVSANFPDYSRLIWLSPPLSYYLKSVGGGFAHAFDPEPLTASVTLGIQVLPIKLNLRLEAEVNREGLSGKLDGFLVREEVLKLDGSLKWTWAGVDQVKFSGQARVLRDEFVNPFNGTKVKLDSGVLNSAISFTADSQFNISVIGAANINLPFFGNVASRQFQLQVINDNNPANDFLQAWTSIGFDFAGKTLSKTIGVRILLDGSDASVIGEDDVPIFKSWVVDSSIADLTMHARWEHAAPAAVVTRVLIYSDLAKTQLRATLNEADYAANGILKLDQLGDSRNVYIWVAQTTPGVYDLELVNPPALGAVSYSATTTAKPITLNLGAATLLGQQLTLAYSGVAPKGAPELRFFIDSDGEGFDGVPIGSSQSLSAQSSFSWNAAGLAPGRYHLYAIAQDGLSLPAAAYAASFVTVAAQAALSLTLNAPAQALSGQDFVVLAELRNSGSAAASAVVLKLALPAGLTLVGSSLGQASVDAQGSSIDVGHVPAGQVTTLKLRLHSASAGTIELPGTLDSASWEADLDDNSATLSFPVAASGAAPAVPAVWLADVAVNERLPLLVTPPAGFAPPLSRYSATLANGDALPAWLSLDTATGALRGTPAQAQVGSTLLRLTASTPAPQTAATVSDVFAVQVINVNDAPVGADMTLSTNEDQAYEGSFPAASDADGDTISIAVSTPPAHGSVQLDAGQRFNYTPARNYFGSDSFVYTLSDGKGGSNSYTVSISVRAVNDAPSGSVSVAGITRIGQTLTLVLSSELGDIEGLGAFSYAWLRNGVVVAGATGTSYALTQADVGATLSARVSYVDGLGTTEALSSAATAIVVGFNSVSGSAGHDNLAGSANPDAISGLAGNDTLAGLADDDMLFGGDGNDVLLGGAGSDTLDGGAGLDAASFAGSAAVVASLASGRATQGAQVDQLIDIEALIGSSAADTLSGLDGAAARLGESFRGGGGNDSINGGSGVDTAEFSGPRGNYMVQRDAANRELINVTHRNAGADGSDTLQSVERLLFADSYLAFGARAEDVAKLAFVLWTPAIAPDQGLFAKGISYYDNGYSYDVLVRTALSYWTSKSDTVLALDLIANVPGSGHFVSELLSVMSQNGGGEAGRAAAVKLMADDPANMRNIELAGLLANGIECSLALGFFAPIVG
jgi:Ca2+-binding RTX toxin-like protein